MWRALITLVAVTVSSVVLGIPALLVAVIRPLRRIFDLLWRVWSRIVLAASGVRLQFDGLDQLSSRQAYFFVGNHQSALDIPALCVATRGRIRFMAKKSLFHVPFMGWCMWAHGFIPLNRSNAREAKKQIDAMLNKLSRRPQSMVVFPEGTRSSDGVVGPFKNGALNVCQRAGMPIVPFAIEGLCAVHQRKRFRLVPGDARITFAPPLAASDVRNMRITELVKVIRGEVLRMLAHDPRTLPESGPDAVTAPGERS